MGYQTSFHGALTLSRPLTLKEAKEWLDLCEQCWDKGGLHELGLATYLQWVPTSDLSGVIWDENEKFYEYTGCLQWVIDNLLRKWGIQANGSIGYSGEDVDDNGRIEVMDNLIAVLKNSEIKVSDNRPLTKETLTELILKSIDE